MNKIIIEFFASFLIWLMFAGLIVLWVIDGKIKKEQVIHALVACFFAWLASVTLKEVFQTTRPFLVDGVAALTLTIPQSGAFPSNHAAVAFALATTIWLHNRKVGWLYLACAVVIGAARVLANVHYPVDILGGVTLGIISAFIFKKIHFPVKRG